MEEMNQNLSFDLPKNSSSVIKVVGVGGGGSNAVNYMYEQGIRGVDFVVCNTDAQALNNSPVPLKVQLGVTLTEGLGAGANPEVGERAAMESIDEIEGILEKNTKMIFVTAGMGGGTGTGAAPVVARVAKEMGILTVGIVTIPFSFEGNMRMNQAEKGVEALRQNVDSLIVINNNKLREVYGNLGFKAGFSKADEVLATASRGIAEVITHHYTQNIDLRDARTVLADSGTAIMGSGQAKGEQRALEAINSALDSPLLNDNKIRGANNVLLLIVSGNEEITIDEIGEINDFIQREAGGSANIIMGIGEDETLGDHISVTVIATGFNTDEQVHIVPKEPKKIVHTLEDSTPSPLSGPITPEAPIAPKVEEPAVMESPIVEPPAPAEPEAEASIFEVEPQGMVEEAPEVLSEVEMPEVEAEVHIEPQAPIVHSLDEEVEAEDEDRVIFTLDIDEDEEEDFTVAQADTAERPDEEETQNDHSITFELRVEDEVEQVDAAPAIVDEEVEEEVVMTFAPAEPIQETEPAEPRLEDHLGLDGSIEETPNYLRSQPEQRSEDGTIVHSLFDEVQEEVSFEEGRAEEQAVEDREVSTATPDEEQMDEDASEQSLADLQIQKARERKARLKAFNYRFKNVPNGLEDLENEPAYKRKGVDLEHVPHSSEAPISRYTLGESEEDGSAEIKSKNSFLHDNVD
ncbi:cell division protein FtsZ [Cryomorphaceae bacterium]|nr:cell division protein FtsZ [Cryomorphaceae bacterium]